MVLGGLAILMGPLGFVFGLFVIAYGRHIARTVCDMSQVYVAALFSLWWIWLRPDVKLESFIATDVEHGADGEVC